MRAARVARGTRPMVGGTLHEVPYQRRRPDDFDGGAGDVVLREQAFELRGERGRELADVGVEREEAVGQAELMDAADGFFRSFGGRDEQAERHGVRAGCRSFCGGLEGVGQGGGG